MDNNTIIVIDGISYQQAQHQPIHEGDLVLDTEDGSYGTCALVVGDTIAIYEGGTTELGIPMYRVNKLIPVKHFQTQNQIN